MPSKAVNDPEAATAPGMHLAGSLPGGQDNGLAVIRDALLRDPRHRRLVICEVVNMRTVNDHPEDGEDVQSPIVRVVTAEPVLAGDDAETVRRIRDQLRGRRTGQGTLEGQQTLDSQEPTP